jgi:gas vesicle protein
MSKGKFALGALIGAVAGVVAGVLTAPKAGKETRADIKGKATELKEKAAEKAELAKMKSEEVKEKVDDYKERGGRAVEAAKKGFNEKEK